MQGSNLVLIGDSVFDNGIYVNRGESVVDHLEHLSGVNDFTMLLAQDGSKVADVLRQVSCIPSGATHIALSAGGNNALACLQALRRPWQGMTDALTFLGEIQSLFRTEFRTVLAALTKLGMPVLVCTVYDAVPGLTPPLKAALSLFNDVITREAMKAGATVLDLRELMLESSDFSEVSPIEPSGSGGKKIAQALAQWCKSTALGNDCHA